jgi:DNA-directed RNA polymerase specialized sigma24 family protein
MTPQERDWIERARAGEPMMRDTIILSLQGKIAGMAYRLMQHAPLPQTQGLEQADLINSANAEMLEYFPLALSKDAEGDNPFAYLLQVAKRSMYSFFTGRHNTIRTDPKCHRPIEVLSLDMLLPEWGGFIAEMILPSAVGQEKEYTTLYQAIQLLPEKQQQIIKRHYGLQEYAPEPLMAIARELSPHTASRPKGAHYHHKRAIVKLHTTLQSSQASHSCSGGGA